MKISHIIIPVTQVLATLLNSADARIGSAAADTARARFVAIQQHLAESCRREEALLEDLAALEEQEAQRQILQRQRQGSELQAPPSANALEPEALIADSRCGHRPAEAPRTKAPLIGGESGCEEISRSRPCGGLLHVSVAAPRPASCRGSQAQ